MVRFEEGCIMKVLIVDDREILHKGEYEAEAVVVLYDWGYKVVTKQGGVHEICTDLGNLLSRPNVMLKQLEAVKLWLQKHNGVEPC